jgi:hypothetical protein
MKTLLAILFPLLSSFSFAVETLDLALETNGIKVEYIESSKRGIITVIDCEPCQEKQYFFEALPVIRKQGATITFEAFMNDYWNARSATLFLDPTSKRVIRVTY